MSEVDKHPYVIQATYGQERGWFNSQSGTMTIAPYYGNRYMDVDAAQADLQQQRKEYPDTVALEVVLYTDAMKLFVKSQI